MLHNGQLYHVWILELKESCGIADWGTLISGFDRPYVSLHTEFGHDILSDKNSSDF